MPVTESGEMATSIIIRLKGWGNWQQNGIPKKNKFLKTNIIFFKKFSIVFYFKFNLCNLCKIFSFGKRPTWPHIYTFVMMSDHHITTSPYSQVLNLLPQVQCRRKYTGTQCTRLQLWLTFKHSKAYILTDVVLNITASNISVEAF